MKTLLKRLLRKFHPQTSGVAPNPGATEFEVNNWILSEFVGNRLVPVVGVHPYPLNELMLMAGAVCRFRPTHIFEWGTNIGASARVFFETGRHFRIPLEIHSVDLPSEVDHVEQPGRLRGALVRGKPGVTLHLGDGIETSLSRCKTMPANGRALFFVDGDHGYESVRRELAMILESVKNPAVLLHDTFYQSKDSGYNIGPFEAVRDVLAGHTAPEKFRVIALNTGLPGMTLIYPAQG